MLKSHYLVDPSLRTALEAFPPLALGPDTLPEIRASIAERFGIAGAADDDVIVENLFIPRPGGNGAIRVLAYRPARAQGPLPAIVHAHGGGYVMGVPELCDAQHRAMARDCGVAIYSVDYRLAPETVYPGQLDDVYAVLQWAHDRVDELGLNRAAIGVKGESAGGGIAAGLALLARDRAGPAIAFQLLTFPALDDRTGSGVDPHPYCGEYLWTGSSNRYAWQSLLGYPPGGDGSPIHAAPARAIDLAGLPPTFISVGALDLYLEEDMDYARRLTRAGVPVELHIYPGAIHGFGLAPDGWIDRVSNRDLKEGLMRILAHRAGV